MFIDVKKAFDTVDHKILLDKLNYYGFRGIVNQWFFSYLGTRTQTTEIHSYISDKQNVSCGVPYGSVLGPLLFLQCVNDYIIIAPINLSSSFLQMILTSFTLMKILRHWRQL